MFESVAEEGQGVRKGLSAPWQLSREDRLGERLRRSVCRNKKRISRDRCHAWTVLGEVVSKRTEQSPMLHAAHGLENREQEGESTVGAVVCGVLGCSQQPGTETPSRVGLDHEVTGCPRFTEIQSAGCGRSQRHHQGPRCSHLSGPFSAWALLSGW